MVNNKLHPIGLTALATIAALTFAQSGHATLVTYSTNFESAPTSGLIGDGWKNYVNQFAADGTSAGGYEYVGAGPGGAPAGGPQVSAIVADQGGAAQGSQSLVVYSDYDNGFFMTNGNPAALETNVFQEQFIGTSDIGNTWRYSFDAKRGNIEAPAAASAFIKVFDDSYNLLSFAQVDTSNLDTTWNTFSIDLFMDPVYEGARMQFGFLTNAGGYIGSGNYYDNINLNAVSDVPVPAAAWLFGSALIGLMSMKRKN